jgi:hypothetical protein
MMEDNRIAVLPENGLPVGAFTRWQSSILQESKYCRAGVSAVRTGCLQRRHHASNQGSERLPGTSFEVAGGSRASSMCRPASEVVRRRIGYKVSRRISIRKDWQNHNIYAPNRAPVERVTRDIGRGLRQRTCLSGT